MSHHRWNLPIHLLDCAFFAAHGHASSPGFVVEGDEAEALVATTIQVVREGERDCVLHSSPHLVLLSTTFYHTRLKPLAAQWLWLWLAKHPALREDLGERVQGLRAAVITFLSAPLADATAAFEGMQHRLSQLSRQLLVLGRDWVAK